MALQMIRLVVVWKICEMESGDQLGGDYSSCSEKTAIGLKQRGRCVAHLLADLTEVSTGLDVGLRKKCQVRFPCFDMNNQGNIGGEGDVGNKIKDLVCNFSFEMLVKI